MAAPDLKIDVRVDLAWWAVPLAYACMPFALMAAAVDPERARAGLVNIVRLGLRIHVRTGGRWRRLRSVERLCRHDRDWP